MIIDTIAKFKMFKDYCLSKNHLDEIAFDTETDGLYGPLVGMSFADKPTSGYYIPTGHRTNETQLDIYQIKDDLQEIFNHLSIIGFNINYEFLTMDRYDIKIPNFHDTQVVGWLVDENKSTSLKRRAVEDLKVRKTIAFKDVVNLKIQTAADITIGDMAPYAIQDSLFTFRLFNKQYPELCEDEALLKEYQEIELPTIILLNKMRKKGIKTDVSLIKGIKDGLIEKIAVLKSEIYELAGEEFNINSSKQKQYILYEKLGIPVPAKCYTDKGAAQTNKKALLAIKHDIAKKLLIYSKLQKVVSSFTDSIIDNVDSFNRIRPSFNQVGTVAGRFSCSAPNFQQMPKKGGIRRAFIAESGYSLIVADYSQLELRIAAHYSKDPVMLEAFNNDIDLHSLTASKIMNMSLDEFKQLQATDPRLAEDIRFKAKTINFGVIYGMGAREDLGISKEFINKYFNVFRRLKLYINAHNNRVQETGYTRTISKRKRRIEDVWSNDFGESSRAMRQLFSAHIQGTAADIMKKAMIDIGREFDSKSIDGTIIAQIHDELIIEVENCRVEEAMKITQDCMENAFPLRVKLIAEPFAASNWEDAKKGKIQDVSIEQIVEEFCIIDEE